MAIDRFSGYGFRNVGVGGWEVRDKCARAGRNLNFASAGILLYQVSGASVGSISIGGASLPAAYPKVFIYFVLIGFVWLAYRFLLAYRNAKHTDPWWHLYMRDIVLERHPVTTFGLSKLKEKFAPRKGGCSMIYESTMKDWHTLIYPEVAVNGVVVGKDIEIKIPRKVMMRAHLFCFPRYLISNSDIADMLVPWVLFFMAILSIILERVGFDPAGLYGLIPGV